jgi:hypothetical protein
MSKVVIRGVRRQLKLRAPNQLIHEAVQLQEQPCFQLREFNQLIFPAMNLNN